MDVGPGVGDVVGIIVAVALDVGEAVGLLVGVKDEVTVGGKGEDVGESNAIFGNVGVTNGVTCPFCTVLQADAPKKMTTVKI